MREFQRAASKIKEGNVVVFTGLGISCESGIPTFRGSEGLWERYNPARYATMPQALFTLLESPQEIADFVIDFYEMFNCAQPNIAHNIIAELEQKNIVTYVITQNIDNLHQDAGSQNVCELHGNACEAICIRCGFKEKRTKEDIAAFTEGLKSLRKRWELLKYMMRYIGKCPECNVRLRPNIVFFGEMLPPEELKKAKEVARNCKCFIIVGTSGVVYPAANIPYEAKHSGAFLIEINIVPSYRDIADIIIESPACKAFEGISKYL